MAVRERYRTIIAEGDERKREKWIIIAEGDGSKREI